MVSVPENRDFQGKVIKALHDFWCQTVGDKTLLIFFRSATFDRSRVHEVFSVFAFSEKKVKTVLGRYLKVNLKKFKIGPSF